MRARPHDRAHEENTYIDYGLCIIELIETRKSQKTGRDPGEPGSAGRETESPEPRVDAGVCLFEALSDTVAIAVCLRGMAASFACVAA